MHRSVTILQRVRYSETDGFGVVYYANYLVWFEVGRTAYLREVGLPYRELEARGLHFPVTDVECRLTSPARYDDEIAVTTWIEEIRSREVTFEYEIRCGATSLALGSTVHILVGRDGKARALPVWLRKGLSDTLLAHSPPAALPPGE
jgi:acyl-CoA thioester hydrolase